MTPEQERLWLLTQISHHFRQLERLLRRLVELETATNPHDRGHDSVPER